MKKLVFTLALCLFAGAAFAQMMFPKAGKIMEYSVSIKSPVGDQATTAKQYLKSKTDNKAVVVVDAAGQVMEIPYNLSNNKVSITFKEILETSMGKNVAAKLEVIENSGDIVYPFEFEVGKEYEEVKAKLKATIQGMDMTMDMSMENRKAEAKESITVPAGTFDCIKVVEELVINMMGQEQITETTTWYDTAGVGMVKQIMSGMNGIMTSVTELAKITDK